MQSTDEILDKVNDMTLSDALGVILDNEEKCLDFEGHNRTNLMSAFDDIQDFLLEMEGIQSVGVVFEFGGNDE